MSWEEPEFNPGEKLRDVLMECYPPDASVSGSFVNKIDRAFQENGKLSALLYQSTINYVTRRLIATAKYFSRKCEKLGQPENAVVNQIRSYLETQTEFPSNRRELILTLLLQCTKIKRKGSLAPDRRRAEKGGSSKCYICGRELDYTTQRNNNSATMDHRWPNAIGGLNKEFNLVAVCGECNNKKADFIDASDFHYEHIYLVTDRDDESFSKNLKPFMIALLAKSDFKCVRCGRPTSIVGKLEIAREKLSDSWHFFNIVTYCTAHYPKAQRMN